MNDKGDWEVYLRYRLKSTDDQCKICKDDFTYYTLTPDEVIGYFKDVFVSKISRMENIISAQNQMIQNLSYEMKNTHAAIQNLCQLLTNIKKE
jgi:hypothetical protein